MERFDKKGMLLVPNPVEKKAISTERVLVINELFCPEGHNIISNRSVFNGYAGIMMAVHKGRKKGLIALSPIYGEKARISLDIDLENGEIVKLCCPVCDTEFPVYSTCDTCGANFIAMFLTPEADFTECVGVCNRVGCTGSCLVTSGELISQVMLEAL